jgi:hypothetical protein
MAIILCTGLLYVPLFFSGRVTICGYVTVLISYGNERVNIDHIRERWQLSLTLCRLHWIVSV